MSFTLGKYVLMRSGSPVTSLIPSASAERGQTGDWSGSTAPGRQEWTEPDTAMARGSGQARQIDHHDIPLAESAEFPRKVLRGLMAKWGIG